MIIDEHIYWPLACVVVNRKLKGNVEGNGGIRKLCYEFVSRCTKRNMYVILGCHNFLSQIVILRYGKNAFVDPADLVLLCLFDRAVLVLVCMSVCL